MLGFLYSYEKNQYKLEPSINDAIFDLLENLSEDAIDENMSVEDVIEELRKIEDPVKINSKWNQMSLSDPIKYPTFAPISRDGVFYESNANERLLSGDVPFEGTLIFGLNSYEGTLGELSYGWMESFFRPEMVKNVFITCKGFVDVPEFQHEKIVELYFDIYKGKRSLLAISPIIF